ncbi:uncharacterized protein [Aegilops tauschii subsp. strangulata]|uniref:uncharacterized protein n=1 Tax=Aegilops tauschii subsp. strangulata TaxID=200361 RepID=UPI00098B86FE
MMQGTLPGKEEDAERVAWQATAYCIQDGELYRKRPNDVSLRCISREQGCELLADIHGRDCGHHSSSRTLVGMAFHGGFYWPTALNDATEMEDGSCPTLSLVRPARGLGRCVRALGCPTPRAHLAKALSPQSFGSLDLREAPSNELVIGDPS